MSMTEAPECGLDRVSKPNEIASGLGDVQDAIADLKELLNELLGSPCDPRPNLADEEPNITVAEIMNGTSARLHDQAQQIRQLTMEIRETLI